MKTADGHLLNYEKRKRRKSRLKRRTTRQPVVITYYAFAVASSKVLTNFHEAETSQEEWMHVVRFVQSRETRHSNRDKVSSNFLTCSSDVWNSDKSSIGRRKKEANEIRRDCCSASCGKKRAARSSTCGAIPTRLWESLTWHYVRVLCHRDFHWKRSFHPRRIARLSALIH